MTSFKQKFFNKDYWGYGLFWSWNLIFLAFMTLGFAPRIIPEMIMAVGTSTIPAAFLAYALILTAVPVLAIILGITLLRKAPARLFALGYVVEGPLMLILAIRFFLIREGTPALTFILAIAGIGMAVFLWHILDPTIEKRRAWVYWLQLAGLTLMLLASLYAATWIAFYALPLSSAALQWFGRFLGDLTRNLREFGNSLSELFREQLIWVPFTILGFILFLYTATLFILAPLAVPYLSMRAWWRTLKGMSPQTGWRRPLIFVVITLTICGGLFILSNRQPQQQAFTLLENPPANADAAQDLLKKQEKIRAGLLNAYLAPFRYMSAVGEVVHVRYMYEDVFNLSEIEAANVQRLYEGVARPLLYNPIYKAEPPYRQDNVALRREPQEAAALYQQFFDQTIVDGERSTIVQAVRSTWSLDQAEAAWQAVDDREIYLVHQEVTVTEHSDWAEVELHEAYQNQTSEQQEVIYYFNLPESAVLTGVWLGDNPARAERFAYQVAPRGAAQAVYRNETRQFRDPALLEQIGPRQYRLRVFPIPPVQTTWDEQRAHTIVEEAPAHYMWLTYQVMVDDDTWPLPQLAYKRNVYWNADTERLINGFGMTTEEDAWLPRSIPVAGSHVPSTHRVDLPGDESVLAIPISQVELPALPAGLHLAIVLDRSRSMARHADQVADALAQLEEAAGVGAALDVYLTASTYRGEGPYQVALSALDPQEILYFGGQNAAELLAQFETLRADQTYDAVLVFTDGSGYELGESDITVPIPPAPVWMIHLGSDIPLGYDDETLEAIQASGGGVVGELGQALTRLAVASTAGDSGGEIQRDVVDGYLWSVLPTNQAAAILDQADPKDDFIAFAARRMILAEMQRQGGKLRDPQTLDQLHELAVVHHIVTPYSSMIVLVTSEQQKILDHLAQGDDRFEREFESLTDTTPSTPLPLAGVPEPHEWLLIGTAVAMLLWYVSKNRLILQRRRVETSHIQ